MEQNRSYITPFNISPGTYVYLIVHLEDTCSIVPKMHRIYLIACNSKCKNAVLDFLEISICSGLKLKVKLSIVNLNAFIKHPLFCI